MAEHADEAHVVGFEHGQDVVDVVGRVDDHGFTGLAVADEVGEVDHLPGHLVALGDVPARQQLAEIQAIVHSRIVGV